MSSEKRWRTSENAAMFYLETDHDHFLRQTAKPTYISCKIFSENLVSVNIKRESLKLDKPSYVGMCISDLSKIKMYDFHYNYIKRKYNERVELLFTDTDSLCYHRKTDDAYRDFYHGRELFDNSDCNESSQFFFNNNKKVIVKFKDEAAGNPIIEFVDLKSKCILIEQKVKITRQLKVLKRMLSRET